MKIYWTNLILQLTDKACLTIENLPTEVVSFELENRDFSFTSNLKHSSEIWCNCKGRKQIKLECWERGWVFSKLEQLRLKLKYSFILFFWINHIRDCLKDLNRKLPASGLRSPRWLRSVEKMMKQIIKHC